MKHRNCKLCEFPLYHISFTGVKMAWLNHREPADLYVCTTIDCTQRGLVLAFPREHPDMGITGIGVRPTA